MTSKQLKESTLGELILAYKEKARCYYSERKANSIYGEMERRLGSNKLQSLRLSVWHMQHGEGDDEFNEECDVLIKNMEI